MPDIPAPDTRIFIYDLDAKDRIVAVNAEWLEFARENDASHLTRAAVLQRSLWDFVTGADARMIYATILGRVRTAQVAMRVPFRCDAPDLRRFMTMDVSLLPHNGARMSCRVLRAEPRVAVRWPDSAAAAERRLISMCSWCKRVRLPTSEWVELEEAVSLFERKPGERMPGISHGICDTCAKDWLLQLSAK